MDETGNYVKLLMDRCSSYQAAGTGVQTRFVYGPAGELLYEARSDGQTRHYVWWHGQLVAVNTHAAQASATHAVYVDGVGRPYLILNAARAVQWRAQLGLFDRTVAPESTLEFNLGFPGQYFDAESGLWYNWHRYYDASVGRYTQADPIGLAGGVNLYAYVGGNPLSFVDPTGLQVFVCNRPVNGFPFVGNHAYLWNANTGSAEGMRGSYGFGMPSNEKGPRGDACREVPDSKGKEHQVMDHMQRYANMGMWLPVVNDCHTAVAFALRANGLHNPGAPGGRFGLLGDVPSPADLPLMLP